MGEEVNRLPFLDVAPASRCDLRGVQRSLEAGPAWLGGVRGVLSSRPEFRPRGHSRLPASSAAATARSVASMFTRRSAWTAFRGTGRIAGSCTARQTSGCGLARQTPGWTSWITDPPNDDTVWLDSWIAEAH